MNAEVIVIGAGGHAKVCIELLSEQGFTVVFCVGEAGSPDKCLGVSVLKGDHHLEELRLSGYSKAFVAIGHNNIRFKLGSLATQMGYELINAISTRAMISPTVKLGSGVAIMGGTVINSNTSISDLAIVNSGAIVEHDCQIGEASHVGPACALAGNATVGRLSFLGIGSRVLPGIHVEDEVVVGAGSVVISNLPQGVTAVGCPARVKLRAHRR
jgi:UDP-perosamine 4-acetyltransferase